MRHLLYLSISCVVLFSACTKETTGASPGTLSRWQWDHSFGGFGATTINPSANTSVVLVLSEDMTYRIEKNGQLALSDSFQSKLVNGIQVLKFKNYGTVDKLSMYPEVSAKIENGKLTLSDMLSDGMAHYFNK